MPHSNHIATSASLMANEFHPQPGAIQEILEFLPPGLNRQLGYFGGASCVLFFYDTRADDVIWDDGRRHGIGTGGWQALIRVIEPLARKYLAVLNGRASAPQALVLDHDSRSAYFADMSEARHMVLAQHQRKSSFF